MVTGFCSGFPGILASSHPGPRVLSANKHFRWLTVGKNCRTRNYLLYLCWNTDPSGWLSSILSHLLFVTLTRQWQVNIFTWWFRGKCSIVYETGRESKWVPWHYELLLIAYRKNKAEAFELLGIVWFLAFNIHFLILVTICPFFSGQPSSPICSSLGEPKVKHMTHIWPITAQNFSSSLISLRMGRSSCWFH